MSILLDADVIDFGIGFVNTSKQDVCGSNATLIAGRYYTDYNDCWTAIGSAPPTPGGFNITNDGNRNVTVCLRGPDKTSFFNSYSGGMPYDINWSGVNITGCAVANLLANVSFSSVNKTVCSDLKWENGIDRIGVDVLLRVPSNLLPGAYSNGTIDFTAFQTTTGVSCSG